MMARRGRSGESVLGMRDWAACTAEDLPWHVERRSSDAFDFIGLLSSWFLG